MSTRCKIFENPSLKVGRWVQFETSKEELTENQKNIYQKNKYFLIVSCKNNIFLGSSYTLVDVTAQKIYDYCPGKNFIGSTFLVLNSNVTVISEEKVLEVHGEENVKAANEIAKKYI
ncbi:MAG: hypothetical protein K940chlam1_01069 [Candidatus Anoxychlamydiales bacterium]|nr:hypothetical protein [Candidatus Anoxychlamydiales bacterium]NGX36001.1 hypothetical protein [Candidatus Anoxychlamydiales bacterium]